MTPSASVGDTIHGEIALFGENKGEPIYPTKVVPRVKSSYHVIDFLPRSQAIQQAFPGAVQSFSL